MPARQLDTKLAPQLFALPFADMVAEGLPGNRASLATRNLLRGQSLGLPSGQAVAKAINAIVSGVPVLGPADFPELTADLAPLASATPLWYYIFPRGGDPWQKDPSRWRYHGWRRAVGTGGRSDRRRNPDRAAQDGSDVSALGGSPELAPELGPNSQEVRDDRFVAQGRGRFLLTKQSLT